MLFFIGSIVFSSYLTLSFKVLERYHIPVLPTIVFNYWVCVITGSFVNGTFPINSENMAAPWFKWALAIGCLFIILFNIIAWTTQKIGVAVISVSNKLSLIIPAIFFIITKNDSTAFWKMTGIILALLAVVFTCYPGSGKNKDGRRNHLLYLVPLVLFMGSGVLDTLYKYVEETYLDASNLNAYLITGFATAGTIGAIVLLVRYATGKEKWNPKTLLAGILIGVPNYFSIWCLGKVYKMNWMESSAIIPVNNMGIVLFSSVMAWLLFREKLSLINWLGIFLSLVAIALIAFGDRL